MKENREAEIIKELNKKYGVTWFFNVQDTVNLQNKTPIGVEGTYRLFIGLKSVTQKNIDTLKNRYGENLIFQVGIETVSPEMRRVFGKKATDQKDVSEKTELMYKNNIQLHASFVLGGRGETPKSMKQTLDTAIKISKYQNTTWILVSPQLILPGSPDYNALLQMPLMHNKYYQKDYIDITEISNDFMRYFVPNLTRKEIINTIKETFSKINNPNTILDIKGVTAEEEIYIKPRRIYTSV